MYIPWPRRALLASAARAGATSRTHACTQPVVQPTCCSVCLPCAPGGDSEKFKEINEAFDVLRDAEKRKVYDQVCVCVVGVVACVMYGGVGGCGWVEDGSGCGHAPARFRGK